MKQRKWTAEEKLGIVLEGLKKKSQYMISTTSGHKNCLEKWVAIQKLKYFETVFFLVHVVLLLLRASLSFRS